MTILNTLQNTNNLGMSILVCVGVMLLIVVFVFILWLAVKEKYYDLMFIMSVCIMLGLIAFAAVCNDIVGTKPNRVQAVISNDYPAVELLEHYKVIAHDGDLWTLEEIGAGK